MGEQAGTKLNRFMNPLAILFSIFLIGGFFFYWYELRPIHIRKQCYKDTYGKFEQWRASNKANNKEWAESKEWMIKPDRDPFYDKDPWGWWYPTGSNLSDDLMFADCLLKNGMKAELPVIEELKRLRE